MSNIVAPDGRPLSTRRTVATQSSDECRRISEMCAVFGVPGFAEELIKEGLSSVEAWDRLVHINNEIERRERDLKSLRTISHRGIRRF